jgi:UDP-glucuronate 4-epimerase
MKTLVTGGAGFIGSHLCERLLSAGHSVAVLDDFNDFYDPRLKEANWDLLKKSGAAALFRGDICDEQLVARAFAEFRPDAVVHLAARAGVRPSVAQPLLYERVNVGGTIVLLEQARRQGTSRFVLASSSSVYGIANRVPFREDDPELKPISPYAATKIAAEKVAYTYSYLYSLPVVCLRFFTVYGPRQRPDLAIRKFMERMTAGQPVPFFGDGTMGRDYTYVSDTVDGIMAALACDVPYDVFNLGNSAPVTLAAMLAAIERALGRKAALDRQPVPPGDVPITYADLEKSRRVLGYQPRVPFEQGIARMAEWYLSSR